MRLFLLFLVISLGLNAQSYSYKVVSFANGNPGPMKGVPSDLFMSTITFSNSSSSPIQVFVDRFQKNIPPYWAVCYCYIQCHSPADDTVTVNILPFSTTDVTLQFKTDSVNPGIALADFRMYQKGIPANTQTISMMATTMTDVGLREFTTAANVDIFPNPATSKVTVESTSEIKSVKVFALTGQLKLQEQVGGNVIILDTDLLQPGIYFIEVTEKNSVSTHKFIKQ